MIESTGEWNSDWLIRGVRVHRTAIVDNGASIGTGTTVWHFTHVRESAVIGEQCVIGQGCYVDATVKIGARCKIANGVQIYAGVSIGSGVFIGPNSTFTNDLWPRAVDSSGAPIVFDSPEKTQIEDGASIGAGCVILPVKVGKNAMIGAGAVVSKDVEAETRYIGKTTPCATSIHR